MPFFLHLVDSTQKKKCKNSNEKNCENVLQMQSQNHHTITQNIVIEIFQISKRKICFLARFNKKLNQHRQNSFKCVPIQVYRKICA